MTTPTPVLLPEGFRWNDIQDGCELLVGRVRVLQVLRQNSGWVVRVDVPEDPSHARKVVVGSRVAGVRFGNKWARAHKDMVARFNPGAGLRRPGGRRSPSGPGPAESRLRDVPAHASAAGIVPEALRQEIDEARALKEELNSHLERIELMVEEMTR